MMYETLYYLLAILLLAALTKVIQNLFKHPRRQPYPPGPKPLPVIGNLFDVPTDPQWLGYSSLSQKYGDVVFIEVLGQPMLVLGSAEAAFDLLDRRSAIYSDRPQTAMMPLMDWGWAFALMPYGTPWRDHRREFHRYFNNVAVTDYAAIMEQQQLKFLDALKHQPEDIRHLIRLSFGAMIFKVIYGIEITDPSDEHLCIAENSVRGLAEALIPGKYWIDFLPFLKYVPPWMPGATFQKVASKWKPSIKAVREVPFKAAHDTWISGATTGSVVEKMLGKLDQSPSPEMDRELYKETAATGFIGGADTSTSNAQAFFLAMAMHPDAQRKAQAELDAVIGPNRLPRYADRSSLPYINAVVKESLRWQPVTPLGGPHKSTADDEYRGWFIPKGTIVIANQWAILHDPEMYPEPERFIPDRFIENGEQNPRIRNPNTTAFGYGRRICPGQHFAEMGLFLTIASVLHVFNITPPTDKDGRPIQLQARMTSSPASFPEPFKCVIKPRSEARVALIHEAKMTM